MTIDSLEEENMLRLMKECEELKKQYNVIKKKTVEALWLDDLRSLEKEYEKYIVDRTERVLGVITSKKNYKKSKK